MASPIAQERIRKTRKKAKLILAIVFYLYVLLSILSTGVYRRENIRADFMDAIMYGFSHPYMLSSKMLQVFVSDILYIFVATLMLVALLWMQKTKEDNRKHDNPDTVHGKAHFMTLEELDQYNIKRTDPIGLTRNDGPNNMLLSQDVSLAIDNRNTRRNCNILCIGGSGAGKSRFFISPNVLQYNANFIITDPSGEMLHDYGKALEDNGYKVKVFNLVDVYKGNRYNPFHYIKTEKDVFILTETLIKNTTPEGKGAGDPFWENSEKLLISALALYLWHTCPEEEQTFSQLVDLINLAKVDENDSSTESPLDKLFDDLEVEDKENLAVKQYKKFKQGAGKTLKSILISVGVRLQSFDLSDIQYLTSKDEMEFESFADTRQALFIIIPTADTTFNFIVSMLYSQLFMTLYNYCETRAEYGWQCYIPMQTHYTMTKKGKKDPPTSGKEILKVVQAGDSTESQDAQKDIRAFVDAVQTGKLKTEYNEEKKLYEVYVTYRNGRGEKVKELVGWRGTKELLENFKMRLKQIKMEPCRRACPIHVRFLLDEFANIGQIPEFDQKLATIRKYEISCAIVLQAISQLQQIYDKKWNTIAGNCDTKLFLGSDDNETIKWLLETIGKKTVKTMSTSFNDNKSGSESFQTGGEDLITASDLTLMKEDECLVRVRGVAPYFGKKYEITLHPNYKYAHSMEGKFEIKSRRTADDESFKPLRERTGGADIAKAAAEAEQIEQKEDQNAEDLRKETVKARNKAMKKNSAEAKEGLKNLKKNGKIAKPFSKDDAEDLVSERGYKDSNDQSAVEKAANDYIELYAGENMDIIDYNLFE